MDNLVFIAGERLYSGDALMCRRNRRTGVWYAYRNDPTKKGWLFGMALSDHKRGDVVRYTQYIPGVLGVPTAMITEDGPITIGGDDNGRHTRQD